MADKITKLYNLAKERGVLTDGLTEDMFRKQTDTEEKLKGFYDIASPKIKLGSWDTFKTNFQNASAPQQETKPEAQPQKRQGLIGGFAAATAPQTLTETDVDYSKSAEGMQDAAIKRQNAAKLPGEKKERNDVSIGESYQKPYDLITGNIPDDVTLNAEGLTIQTAQAEKERADIANQYAQNKEYPHSPYKPVDPAEELDKKYPTGKYTNQEEIYQAVWSSAKQNDPELAKRFADADAELQALIDETKTNLKKTEDELVGLVRSGKMSTEEAQDRYNTIHDEEVAKVGAFQERTFTKIYNSANEKYQDYIIGQTRKLAQRELASELPAIKEEALKAARVSDVSTDRYAVSAAEIADRAMKLNNAGINRDKEGFGAGFKAGITDSYTWTSGVLEAIHGVQGKKVLDKYYAGEQLTEGENALLKSLTYYMAAEAYNSPLLKRMYKAGMTSAQSIPFMLEFVAANPALLQDAVIKKLVGYGMEEFGKQGGKVLAKELGAHALGTMAGAGAMTATFGAPRIVAGTAQRMNGTVETPFADGTSAFTLGKREGQQSFGEAAWNATVDTFVENLSEMILTNNPLTKRFGEAMKPITSTMADNPIGQIVAKIWDTPQWKEFATRAQYGGSIEEFNEELIGNVMRWGFSTDTHDKNKTWRENAGLDADTLTDTALGVIPMTMAMTGGNLLFGASITIADVVSDKKLVKKAGVGAILDEISKAKASNDMIIPMTSLHKSLQENKELTQDEKNKIFDSAENELIKKIREEAEEQRAKDEETANLTPAEEEAKAAVDNINEQTNDDDELMYNVSVSGKDGEWRIKGGTPIHVDENGQLVSDEDLTGKPEFYKPTIVVIGTDANGKKVEFQTTIDKLTLLDQPISAEQAAAGVATNLAADKVMEAENAEHVWYEKDGQAFELTKDGDEYTFVATGDKVDASMLADMGYKETADPNAPVETPEAAEPERTPVQIATDDFVAKHGENAVTKLGTTIKAVEKDKKDAEKKLADAKKKLADLPDAYNEATSKAEEKAQQDVANAQAKVDEYSGILERYNGIKAEMDARAAAEVPTVETPAEESAPVEVPAAEAAPAEPIEQAPASTDPTTARLQEFTRKGVENLTDEEFAEMKELVDALPDWYALADGVNTGDEVAMEEARKADAEFTELRKMVEAETKRREKPAEPAAPVEKGKPTQEEKTDAAMASFPVVGVKGFEFDQFKNWMDQLEDYVSSLPAYSGKVLVMKVSSGEYIAVGKSAEALAGISGVEDYSRQNTRPLVAIRSDKAVKAAKKAGVDVVVVDKAVEGIKFDDDKFYVTEAGKAYTSIMENGIFTNEELDKYESVLNEYKSSHDSSDPFMSKVDDALAEVKDERLINKARALEKQGNDALNGIREVLATLNGLNKNKLSIDDCKSAIQHLVKSSGLYLDAAKLIKEAGRGDGSSEMVANNNRLIKLAESKIAQLEKESLSIAEYAAQKSAEGKKNERIDGFIEEGRKFSFTYEGEKQSRKTYIAEKGHSYEVITKADYDYAKQHGGKMMSDAEAKDREEYAELNKLSEWWTNKYAPIGSGRELDKTISAILNSDNEAAKKDLPKMKRLQELESREREISRRLSDGTYEDNEAPADKPAEHYSEEQQQEQTEHQEQKSESKGKKSSSWGSKNKVFSQDAYEEARARMRARLNRLNAGIDPQALLDGMIVAGYHVEAGARKFVEYAKKMLEDFGEGIRPYLKAYYNGMRDLPEAAELAKEMDDFATVSGIDVNTITLEEPKPQSKYKVGDIVYYGGMNGMLQAKVAEVNSDGTYAISNDKNATKMSINMMNINEKDLYDIKETDRMYEFFKKQFVSFIEKQNFTQSTLKQLESQIESEIDKLKKRVEQNNGGTEIDMVEGIRLNGMLSAVLDALDNTPTDPKGGKKAEKKQKDLQKPLQNQENSVPLQENPAIGKVTKDVDTRDNTDLWVVKPEERTDKETFDGLKKRAKAFNGAWSGFKKGFIFRSEEEANNFNNKSVEAPSVTEAPKQQLTIREAAAAKAKEKKQPKEDNNGESNVRRSSGSSDAGGQMPSNIERVLARRRSKATGQDSGRDDRGGEATGTGGRTSGDVGRLPSVRVSGLNKRNFTLDRGQDAAPTTNRERYAANVAAIRLLKKLQEEEVTEATKEQQEILSKFSGWGGLGEFFNSRSSFRTYNELKSLLTEEEFDAANMSRNSAYFTPSGFVDIMWDIARKMGYRGGRFAENSAGIGNIISHMPADLADKSVVSAVEIDPITGGMLKYLYPDAEVHNTGFENVSIPNNSIDLEITNVPFVTGLRVSDKDEKDLAKRFKNLHDFCIAKNIRKLSEGGIGIFITTSGTLDSSRDLRNWITKEGNTDVVGAFRLNSESFGGASVTSDIIVVRKRVNGEVSPQAINVLETGIVRNTVDQEDNPRALSCNKYFIEHPEFMGGEMGFGFEHGDTRWGGTTTQCYPSADINQEERLKNWLNTLMEQKPVEKKPIVNEEFASNKKYEEVDSAYSEGELITTKDGTVCVSRGGRAVPLDVNANKVKGQTKAQCIADYNAIKYALEDLLAKEQETNDDAELAPYLKELNRAYDNFVSIYGNLNKNTAISFLKNDVYFPGIASLEHYEETEDINGKKKITTSKTDIFNKRVLGVKTEVKATNAKDGVILSMRQYGEIRPSEIASWLGKDIESVKKEIVESGLGFIDPVSENVVVSYEYLSGNVREKLEYAKSHNTNGVYDKNIEALNKVIPTTIPSSFIQFQLGSTWIPVELYGDYVRDKFGIENVNFANAANTWVTNAVGDYQLKREKNRGAGVHSDLLNKDATGFEIFMNAINNKPTTLSVIEKDMDGRSHTVVDKDASQAASAKADEMRDDFVEYVRGRMSDDQELAMRMEKTYNDKFNAIAPKKIGAEFMSATLEGMNPNIKLRPHQQEAVVIATTQPVMLAHEVGTGKTFTMISAAMEMRRLGTAKKPMIVVQNATVGQFVASAKLLYPSARVLTVSEKDKSAEGRKEFYAKIKYNDWDLIIVPQSVFDMIPDNEERMQAFIQEKIDEKMAAINQAKAAKVDTRKISALESELKKLQDDFATGNMSGKKNKAADEKKEAIIRQNASVRAEEQMDRKTDDTEDFDTMGIDALLIDEAHNYKHLGFSTNMQRGVKGVDPSYSKRAAALYIKCQSIFERCGHKNVVFATGTPISNTAAEIWTFMKYLYPADFLKANDIYYFDDFVHNFGRISQSLEFTTSGQFKENSRFASYSNIPELARIWSNIAHTILTKEVGEVKDMVPEMEGGKAKDVFLPQSQTLINIMAYVRQQMKEFEEADGRWKREHSYVPLVMFGIARRGAIDPRLVMEKAKDEPESKTNHVVSDVLQALKDSEKYNGTCAVFCDSYRRLKLVGKKKVETFNIFKDIRDKLIKQGVPADQIVIMESNMSIAKKEKIFADVNAGRVRVILGTTATLGTGVNIQERLFFEGHMDTPDRPMDYTQRNGRILRQGNLHKQWGIPVRVVRYGVEDSLDVTGYQRLKTKSQFIDSIMESKRLLDNNLESRMLEESEEGLFDNPVAVLSGSQYAMLKSQAERELRKLESKKNDFMRQQIEIESRLRSIANQVSFKSGVLQKMLDREALIKEVFPNHTVDKMTIDGMDASTDEAKKEALKAVRDKITDYMNSVTNDSTIRPESSKTHNIPFTLNDVDFVLQLTLTKKVGYKDGEYKHYTDRKFAVKCPRFSIDQEVNSVDVKNIIDGIISSYIVEDSASSLLINRYKVEIADYRKDIDELNKRRGMVFTGDADIEKARKRVEEYTELMREEMAEKQSKYAGQETGDIDLDSEIVDEDESDGEVSLSAGDNQGVEEYENGLTEAQQAATDAVITMLEDAGIKVNRISNEEADKLSEEEGASFSKRVSPDPKKTQKVYKLMRLGKDGKLYPLFIDASEGIELGSWWDADSPNMDMLKDMPSGVWLVDAEKQTYQSYDEFYKEHPEMFRGTQTKFPSVSAVNYATANGLRWVSITDEQRAQKRYGGETRKYMNLGINGSGTVSEFAMRPGWHAGSLPSMRQIGKGKNKDLRDDSFVWVEGEVPADIDYQVEADANPDKDIPTHIPTDGYYMKATNADKGKSQSDKIGWYVAGSFKPVRIMSDSEARSVIDQWNNEHPNEQVAYDYQRESGMEFNAETMQLEKPSVAMSQSGEKVYGFTKDGEITLSERGINPNTPAHEYSHVWCPAVRIGNPKLWANVKELFKPYLDEVRNDEAYKGLSEDGMVEEAVARFSGKRGAERAVAEAQRLIDENPSIKGRARARMIIGRIKQALDKLWSWIGKNLFKIERFNSPEEVADRIMYDLVNKTNLRTGKVGEGMTQEDIDAISRKEANYQRTSGSWKDELEDSTDPHAMTIPEKILSNTIAAAVEHEENTRLATEAVRQINARLADLRKAMYQQKITDRDALDKLTSMAKIFLKNGWVGAEDKAELREVISTIGKAANGTMEDNIQRMMMAVTKSHLSHTREAFNTLRHTKSQKLNISGVVEQGAVDVETQYRLATFNEGIKVKAEKLDEYIHEALDKYNRETDDTKKAQYASAAYGYMVAQKYLETVGELREEAVELEKVLREVKDKSFKGAEHPILAKREALREAKEAIITNRLEQVKAYDRMNQELFATIYIGKAKAAAFRKAQVENMNKIRHFANSDTQGVSTSQFYKSTALQNATNSFIAAGGLFSPLQSLNSMLKVLAPKAPNGQGYLYDHFIRGYVDSSEAEYRGLKEVLNELDAKAAEILGKKADWADMAEKLNKGNTLEVSIIEDDDATNVELTQGQLGYLYAINKMADGRMKLRAMGIAEADMARIEEALDPKVKELMDWLQSDFLPRTRNKYNKVYEQMFGAPMAAIDNYFPLRINKKSLNQSTDLANDMEGVGNLSGTTTGAIKERRRNSKPIDIMNADAFNVMVEHLTEMEHWAAFAQLNRDANILMSYTGFKNKLGHMTTMYGSGKQLENNLKDCFKLALGTYDVKKDKASAFELNLAKGISTSKITLRIWTAAKQILSHPAFYTEIAEGDGTFVPEYLKNLATPYHTYKWAMDNLPLFEKRVRSRQVGDTRLMDNEEDWKVWHTKVVEWCTRIGMSPNAFVDALTCAQGAKAVYESHLRMYIKRSGKQEAFDNKVSELKQKYLEEGMNEIKSSIKAREDAIDIVCPEENRRAKQDASICYNETQQSSEGAFVSTVQRDQNAQSIFVSLFNNANMAYMRRLNEHAGELYESTFGKGKDEQIEYLTKKYIRMGLDEDNAAKYAKTDYNRSIGRSIFGIATFGYLMQAIWRLGGYIPYLLFGDDDDEKEKLVKKAFTGGALATPVRGTVLGKGLEAALDGYGWKNVLANTLPIEEDIKNYEQLYKSGKEAEFVTDILNMLTSMFIGINPETLTNMGIAIVDAFDGDLEYSKDFTTLLFTLMSVPESQIKKMYVDELGASGEEILRTVRYNPNAMPELAKRYAERNMKRTAPFFPRSEEEKQQAIKSSFNSIKREATERIK